MTTLEHKLKSLLAEARQGIEVIDNLDFDDFAKDHGLDLQDLVQSLLRSTVEALSTLCPELDAEEADPPEAPVHYSSAGALAWQSGWSSGRASAPSSVLSAEETEWAVKQTVAIDSHRVAVYFEHPDRLSAERFIANPPLWYVPRAGEKKVVVCRRKASSWEVAP